MVGKGFFLQDSVERDTLNQLATEIVDAAVKVHRTLGPGLLESAYESCLAYELGRQGLKVEQQKFLPLIYEELKIENGYRLDLLVEDKILVEVKAVAALIPLHRAQLLTYLKLSSCKLGFIINFNVGILQQGIQRLVYG